MKPLTGRKVLVIGLCAFGTIITANLALAIAAVGSFPGVEVSNGYVASQRFEAERAAQIRLGWRAEAEYDGTDLTISLLDKNGDAIAMDALTTRVGRPTGRAEDMTDRLIPTTDGFSIPLELDRGLWRVDLLAQAQGENFRQHLTIKVTK